MNPNSVRVFEGEFNFGNVIRGQCGRLPPMERGLYAGGQKQLSCVFVVAIIIIVVVMSRGGAATSRSGTSRDARKARQQVVLRLMMLIMMRKMRRLVGMYGRGRIFSDHQMLHLGR